MRQRLQYLEVRHPDRRLVVGRGRAGQFGQVAAADGEGADQCDLALVDVKEPAVRAQPGVDGTDTALVRTVVPPSRVRAPLGAMEYRETVPDPVLTANR